MHHTLESRGFWSLLLSIILFMICPMRAQSTTSLNVLQGYQPTQPQILISHNRTSTELDSTITAYMQEYQIPGLSGFIIKGDSVMWHNNFGMAELSSDTMVTDSTIFTLASLSKPVTAIAVMQLWESNQLDLDVSINDYLPYTIQNPFHPGSVISIRHLLTHTSSVAYSAADWIPLITWGSDPDSTLNSFLQNYLIPGGAYFDCTHYLDTLPGTVGEYSNIGYSILAEIVAVVSGQTFEEYCQTHIFLPLGMNKTSWFLGSLNESPIARPTEYDNGTLIEYPHPGFPCYPSSRLRTSTRQFQALTLMLKNRGIAYGIRILNSATVDSMLTIQFDDLEVLPGLQWGLGIFSFEYDGDRLWGHTGGFPGMYAEMFFSPTYDYAWCFFSNRLYSEGLNWISATLYDEASSTPLVSNTEVSLPIEYKLQAYPNPFNTSTTMSYDLPAQSDITLTVYDISGREVTQLVHRNQEAGSYSVQWNGMNAQGQAVSAGTYLVRMQVGSYSQTIKTMYVK